MAASTTQRDYYEVLGVPHDASDKAIKDAFRQLALTYHPDRSKEPDAEERFKEIAEAYAVLSDPKKRADYDARGFAGVAGLSPEDLFAGIDFVDLFGPFGTGGFGAESLFDRLSHPGRRARAVRGQDLQVPITVPLTTVLTGGHETVTIRRPGACKDCRGTGARAGTSPRTCDVCRGTGQRTTSSRRGNVVVQQITTCPRCGGRRVIIDDPCPVCGGTGQGVETETVKVQVPPGIEDGTALRIRGHGMPPPAPHAEPGDVYVIVRTAADPRFTRHGRDLWHTEELHVADAVLGTSVRVPTLDGGVEVVVPPGTKPGTNLRVAGKGLPGPGGRGKGDLYVTVAVRIPEHTTRHERRLWEELRTASRAP